VNTNILPLVLLIIVSTCFSQARLLSMSIPKKIVFLPTFLINNFNLKINLFLLVWNAVKFVLFIFVCRLFTSKYCITLLMLSLVTYQFIQISLHIQN
jgi:hypothetical protein